MPGSDVWELTSLEVFLWLCPHNPLSPRSVALWVRSWGGSAERACLRDYGNPAGEEVSSSLGLQELLNRCLICHLIECQLAVEAPCPPIAGGPLRSWEEAMVLGLARVWSWGMQGLGPESRVTSLFPCGPKRKEMVA